MKLSATAAALAAVVAMAAAAPSQVEASTCTVANIDFLGTSTGQSCTLYSPGLTQYLGPYGATVLEARLDTFTDVTRAQVRTLVNAQIAKQLSPALNVTVTSGQLTNMVTNGVISNAVATAFPYFVNFTIADQACYTLKGLLATITSCFNKNCTNTAWQYCANPNSPPAAIDGSTFKQSLAAVGVPLITGATAACAGAAAYKASFPTFQAANNGTNYTVSCQILFPENIFGTFQYPTNSPTPAPSASSTLKASVVAVASIFAAALAF